METNSNKHIFKRGKGISKTDGIGFAFLMIIFGGFFLLFNLDLIPQMYKPLLISWQMLLVLMGMWFLTVKRKFGKGLLLIGLGVFFIYPILSSIFPETFVYINIDFRTYWPVFPIFFGILLVVSRLIPCGKEQYKKSNKIYDAETGKWKESDNAAYINGDMFEKNMIFGGSEQILLSQNLKGGEANVIFGELILDLRKTQLGENIAYLEFNAIFGNLIVYIPSEWTVKIDSTTVLGAFQDRRLYKDEISQKGKNPQVVMEANCIFANIEMRN